MYVFVSFFPPFASEISGYLRSVVQQPHFRHLTETNKKKPDLKAECCMGCHFIFSGQTVLFVKAAVGCSCLCQGRREWEDLGLARFRPGDSGAPRRCCCWCSTPSANNTLFLAGHHRGDWLSALRQHEELTSVLLLFPELSEHF